MQRETGHVLKIATDTSEGQFYVVLVPGPSRQAQVESGAPEVYVQTFPASGGRWRVSTGGGCQPRWRRDGRELFYIAADRKLMAVDVKLGETFEAGVPKTLFGTRILTLINFSNHYAVTADGQRFLINSRIEETSATPISVVVNWTADLKR